jgi:RNA polymerase sigma-70 factor (ECF subfamily)
MDAATQAAFVMNLPIHLSLGLHHGLAIAGMLGAVIPVRRALADGRDEIELVERLRAGDEEAFMTLVDRHQATMIRLASSLVRSREVAEDVVQDTWLGALRGVERFAGRSSFKTWLLTILVNRARSAGTREGRSVAIGDAVPAVDSSRFDASGAWMAPPQHWVEDSDDRLLAESLAQHIWGTVGELPDRQREVLILRDVDGLTSEEVCAVLDISEGNQRVLLHRGRSRLRAALEIQMSV